MSQSKNNSLALTLAGALVFGLVALQGCSSDEQKNPASGGSTSHAGSAGKPSTAGTAGTPVSEGGAGGQTEDETAGTGGQTGPDDGAGGEGGTPSVPCDLSFDNSTLSVLTDNGGDLPPLP